MPITQRTVVVLGTAGAVGAAVASGLREAGYQAVEIDGDGSGGTALAAAIHEAAPGGTDAIVDAGFFLETPQRGALALLDAATWQQQAEQPLRRALHVLQAAHRCLSERGGRIVVLLPSLVMSGGADVVAWASAAEGYRSLVKAAARAWGVGSGGGEGITIKSLLVPVRLVADSAVDRPGLQPPALGRTPDLRSDIAPVVAALLDERLDAVTGLTLAVDGGIWMTS